MGPRKLSFSFPVHGEACAKVNKPRVFPARRDPIGVLYRDLTAPALSRRLSLLWRAQWVNREFVTDQGHRHQVYTLGKLGLEWLRFSGMTPRWVTRDGWGANADAHLAHWLGIADIWAQLQRFADKAPGVELTRFEVELEYVYRLMDARTKFKPDAFFELRWGLAAGEGLRAYAEFDRATESLSRWQMYNVQNARNFGMSGRWPWGEQPIDYWVFASQPRLQTIHRTDPEQLSGAPFRWQGEWILIPWEVWRNQGLNGSRQWVFPRSDRSSSQWRQLVHAVNNRSRHR